LKIEELSLRGSSGENLRVYSRIYGEMYDFSRDELIWMRQETIISDESFSLGEYRADNGKKLIDSIYKIFKKVSLRFSLDMMQ
jgi:hypothetical protein